MNFILFIHNETYHPSLDDNVNNLLPNLIDVKTEFIENNNSDTNTPSESKNTPSLPYTNILTANFSQSHPSADIPSHGRNDSHTPIVNSVTPSFPASTENLETQIMFSNNSEAI